jgi:hypothetical protein
LVLNGAPGKTRTCDLLIRSPSWGVFRNSAKINEMRDNRMDKERNKDIRFVHLIHKSPFLPPIYPQITPKNFSAFWPRRKLFEIPCPARKAGKARKASGKQINR